MQNVHHNWFWHIYIFNRMQTDTCRHNYEKAQSTNDSPEVTFETVSFEALAKGVVTHTCSCRHTNSISQRDAGNKYFKQLLSMKHAKSSSELYHIGNCECYVQQKITYIATVI